MNLIWKVEKNPVPYLQAIQQMDNYVTEVIHNKKSNLVWLLEHYDVYTKGTSANNNELLNSSKVPVINTNRGGKITYHGLGQRVIYPIINLQKYKDIKLYITTLENWIIKTLQEYNLDAFTKDDLVGVFVLDNGKENKIAAIGIHVKKWIAYHGISVNISTNLDLYKNIIPCGIQHLGVTSLHKLKKDISFTRFDSVLYKCIPDIFIQ